MHGCVQSPAHRRWPRARARPSARRAPGICLSSVPPCVVTAFLYAPIRRQAFRIVSRSGEEDAAAVVEVRAARVRDVPDIPLGIAPAEAAAPERLRRLLEQLDAVDRAQRLVDAPCLLER